VSPSTIAPRAARRERGEQYRQLVEQQRLQLGRAVAAALNSQRVIGCNAEESVEAVGHRIGAVVLAGVDPQHRRATGLQRGMHRREVDNFGPRSSGN